MSKCIIIPDVHGRGFWRGAVQGHEEDRIIFLGDYVDPYPWEGILPGVAYKGLLGVLDFKKEHPGNVVLLLGNHDLGYLDPDICTCRQDSRRAAQLKQVFEDNLDLFDIVHIEDSLNGKVLFSHAGIAESWLKRHGNILPGEGFRPERLNEMLHGDPSTRRLLFATLADASWYRGGEDTVGSPVWADVQEYLDGERLLAGYLHVFGHTMHEGPAVNVRGHGLCLDCARAFVLDPEDERIPIL